MGPPSVDLSSRASIHVCPAKRVHFYRNVEMDRRGAPLVEVRDQAADGANRRLASKSDSKTTGPVSERLLTTLQNVANCPSNCGLFEPAEPISDWR